MVILDLKIKGTKRDDKEEGNRMANSTTGQPKAAVIAIKQKITGSVTTSERLIPTPPNPSKGNEGSGKK
jgi:hypothetical protein